MKPGTHKAGAALTYKDSQASTTKFVIRRPVAGVRKAGKCVARPRHVSPHAHLHHRTRLVAVGASFTHRDAARTNKLHFSGRIGGHKLAPVIYRLTATPTFSGKTGKALSVRFTIKPPPAKRPKIKH